LNKTTIKIENFEAVLNEHQDKLDRFAELLIAENQKYNLTRITSPDQIRLRHFLDSLTALSVLDALSQDSVKPLRVLDIGSGAGFPGLVLAIVRPRWKVVSLEATAKKAAFQKMVCDELALSNVTVINERAETLAHDKKYREAFDVVTARALAAMPVLAELSLGFLKIGGTALYWKGPGEDLQAAHGAIEHMGARIEQRWTYTLPTEKDAEPPELSLVICSKTKTTPKQCPRVFGVIKKQPL